MKSISAGFFSSTLYKADETSTLSMLRDAQAKISMSEPFLRGTVK
jgi:hypothetical protein